MGTRVAWILACTSVVRRGVQDVSEKRIPDGRRGGALVDTGGGDSSAGMEGVVHRVVTNSVGE